MKKKKFDIAFITYALTEKQNALDYPAIKEFNNLLINGFEIISSVVSKGIDTLDSGLSGGSPEIIKCKDTSLERMSNEYLKEFEKL